MKYGYLFITKVVEGALLLCNRAFAWFSPAEGAVSVLA